MILTVSPVSKLVLASYGLLLTLISCYLVNRLERAAALEDFTQQLRHGRLACRRGDLSTAEECLDLAMERMRSLKWGPTDPAAGLVFTAYGDLYIKQGQFNRARHAYLQTMMIQSTILRSDPSMVGNLNEPAFNFRAHHRYSDAEFFAKLALRLEQNALGRDHCLTAYATQTVGLMYYDQGRYDKAEEQYQRALWLFQSSKKKEYGNTAALLGLARVYEVRGKPEAALPIYRQVLVRNERAIEPNTHYAHQHAEVANVLYLLAGCLRKLQRTDEACAMEIRAEETLRNLPGGAAKWRWRL